MSDEIRPVTPDADRARLIAELRAKATRLESIAYWALGPNGKPREIVRMSAEAMRQAAYLLAAEDDEPDITVGGEPWTEEQLAAVRGIARQGDLKHAKELLEQNGYIVVLPSPPGGGR